MPSPTQLVAWKTAIAESDVVLMTSLNLGDALVIAFHFHMHSTKARPLKIVFEQTLSFRNTANPQGLDYWKGFGASSQTGRTFIVENSPWIKMLYPDLSAFSEPEKSAIKHYVIVSDEYVTEVLSDIPPDIIDSRSRLFEAHL